MSDELPFDNWTEVPMGASVVTPGTRLSWSTPGEWIQQAQAIEGRRCSSKQYQDRRNHLEALTRYDAWQILEFAQLEELVLLDRYLRRHEHRLAPAHGFRAGCAWVRAIDLVNGAITRKRGGRHG